MSWTYVMKPLKKYVQNTVTGVRNVVRTKNIMKKRQKIVPIVKDRNINADDGTTL